MTDVNYTPDFDPVDVDGDYGSTGGDITVPTFHDIKPFRFWCQKALPLVFDDSLSYYEVLCKVVNYLNEMMTDLRTGTGAITQFANQFVINQQFLNNMAEKLGENTEELEDYINDRMGDFTDAYNELQDYVNEYFNNLDVQDEIDTKLDEMAENGQFNVLFDPVIQAWMEEETEYINTSITNQNGTLAQQNGRISVLEGRMDTFASLPSGSTSGNAELLDIRTNFLGETFGSAGDAVRTSDLVASGYTPLAITSYMYDGQPTGVGWFDVTKYKGGRIAFIANIAYNSIIWSQYNGLLLKVSDTNTSVYDGHTMSPDNEATYYYENFIEEFYEKPLAVYRHQEDAEMYDSSRVLCIFKLKENFPYKYIGVNFSNESDITTPLVPIIRPDLISYGTYWLETPIDPTLSVSGEAADAKATGDALSELNERLGNADTNLTNLNNEVGISNVFGYLANNNEFIIASTDTQQHQTAIYSVTGGASYTITPNSSYCVGAFLKELPTLTNGLNLQSYYATGASRTVYSALTTGTVPTDALYFMVSEKISNADWSASSLIIDGYNYLGIIPENVASVKKIAEALKASIATPYQTNGTYAVGDYCIFNNNLYRCIVAIETPEPVFYQGHWYRVTVANEIIDTKDSISNLYCYSGIYYVNGYLAGSNEFIMSYVSPEQNRSVIVPVTGGMNYEIRPASSYVIGAFLKELPSLRNGLNIQSYYATGTSRTVYSSYASNTVPNDAKYFMVSELVNNADWSPSVFAVNGFDYIENIPNNIVSAKEDVQLLRLSAEKSIPQGGQILYYGDTKASEGFIVNAVMYPDGDIIGARANGKVVRIGYNQEETLLTINGTKMDWRCVFMDSNQNVFVSPHASNGSMTMTERGLYKLSKPSTGWVTGRIATWETGGLVGGNPGATLTFNDSLTVFQHTYAPVSPDKMVRATVNATSSTTNSYGVFTDENLVIKGTVFTPIDGVSGIRTFDAVKVPRGASRLYIMSYNTTEGCGIELYGEVPANAFVKVLSLYDPTSTVPTEAESNDDTVWTMCEDSDGNLYAGIYAHTVRANPAIYKSTDGGNTWNYIFNFNTAGLTTDGRHIHSIVYSKWQDALYCIVGEVNTIFKSTDHGTTWTDLNVVLNVKGSAMLATEGGIFIGSDGAYSCRIDVLYNDDKTHKTVFEGYANTCFAIRRSDLTGFMYAFCKVDSSVNSSSYYPPLSAITDESEIITWKNSVTDSVYNNWKAYYDSMINVYPDDAIRPQHFMILVSRDGGDQWEILHQEELGDNGTTTLISGCWTTGYFRNGECLTGRYVNANMDFPIVISEGKHNYVYNGCDLNGEILIRTNIVPTVELI